MGLRVCVWFIYLISKRLIDIHFSKATCEAPIQRISRWIGHMHSLRCLLSQRKSTIRLCKSVFQPCSPWRQTKAHRFKIALTRCPCGIRDKAQLYHNTKLLLLFFFFFAMKSDIELHKQHQISSTDHIHYWNYWNNKFEKSWINQCLIQHLANQVTHHWSCDTATVAMRGTWQLISKTIAQPWQLQRCHFLWMFTLNLPLFL